MSDTKPKKPKGKGILHRWECEFAWRLISKENPNVIHRCGLATRVVHIDRVVAENYREEEAVFQLARNFNPVKYPELSGLAPASLLEKYQLDITVTSLTRLSNVLHFPLPQPMAERLVA